MVKIATLSVATLAALVPVAVAYNCQRGLYYCGYNLLHRGNYYDQIYQALVANGQPTDSTHVNNSFFYCTGGSNGEISFQYFCSGGVCTDGGSDNSDTCPR